MKLLFVLGLFLFTSCSKINMAYDYAPRMVTKSVDNYLDLNSDRFGSIKKQLEIDFTTNKSFLKSAVLKNIDLLVESVDKKTMTEDQVKEFFNNFRKLQSEVIYLFKSSFSETVLNMNQKEFDNLQKEVQAARKKYTERLDDSDKFKKKLIENFEESMEKFVDSVQEEQIKMYKDFVENNFSFYKDQLVYREGVSKKMTDLFGKKEEMLDYVLKYYAGDDSIKPADFKSKQDVFFNNMFTTVTKIWNSLSDKQRAELKKSLLEIKGNVEELK